MKCNILKSIKDINKRKYLYAFNFNNNLERNILENTYSLINKYFKNYIISETNNFGNDIIPSLLLYNHIVDIENLDIKYILKIQKSFFFKLILKT